MFIIIILMFCLGSLASQIATGDLNGDGVQDQVELIWREDSKIPPNLIITLKNKKGTIQKIQSPKAVWQAPASKLSIIKGILHIYYEGGGRSKWTDIYKWRLDSSKKDFVLIGRTYEIEDTIGDYPKERVDANYSTGKIQRTIGKKKKSCFFGSSKKIHLTTFDFVWGSIEGLDQINKACPIKGVVD